MIKHILIVKLTFRKIYVCAEEPKMKLFFCSIVSESEAYPQLSPEYVTTCRRHSLSYLMWI